VCVRILRRDIGHLGFTRGFAIYDEADSLAAVKQALARHRLDPKVVDPRACAGGSTSGRTPATIPPRSRAPPTTPRRARRPTCTRPISACSPMRARSTSATCCSRPVELFERFPEVLAHYRRRWQYVLVDEYQDTNRVQYRLVQQLVAEHGNLCVVGDPDQSIYAWRGADLTTSSTSSATIPARSW
jgi:DNA helicase-2/ATP-dependent DNA helicase PcrA